MSDWPANLTVAPIREWPGALTAERRPSPFRQPSKYVTVEGERKWKPSAPVPLSQTLRDLDRELDAVRARDAELLVAIDAAQFKRDGRPYANARAAHPGVILSFTIPDVGALSYPCDTFTTWEDNLRAVVLALEVLARRPFGWERGPWKTHEEEMARKTLVREVAPYLPKSTEFGLAIQVMRQVEDEGQVVRSIEGVQGLVVGDVEPGVGDPLGRTPESHEAADAIAEETR